MDSTIERPLVIIIICILIIIGVSFVLPAILLMPDELVDSWYPPYLILSAMVDLTCMLGLWHMKKWAVYLYSAFVILNQIVFYSMDVWTVFSIIIPIAVLSLSWKNIKMMQ